MEGVLKSLASPVSLWLKLALRNKRLVEQSVVENREKRELLSFNAVSVYVPH